MRILVTGARDWDDTKTLGDALVYQMKSNGVHPDDVTIVHGAAPGADTLAHWWADLWGTKVESHPADWKNKHRAAGPIRNQEMVDAGADVAVAFYKAPSKGTKDCIKRIKKAGIPLTIYPYNFDNGESVDEVDKLFGEES